MKSEVNAILERLEASERLVNRLESVAARLTDSPLGGEERGWLAAAARRLSASIPAVRAAIETSLDLPELKALRAERLTGLEQAWVGSVRELFGELEKRLGANSPLIEALFPHLRFDRIERPGAAQRAFRAEVSTRRTSTYIQRMSADPEYPFLAGLLEPVERAERALAAFESSAPPGEEELLRLRAEVVEAGQGLSRAQRQARALAEAALIDAPELFTELGFDAPARRRSARPEASVNDDSES
ncbi:MAG TPA: hypothetical protein VFQ35_24930 [Polyangiaceae bacterium]|nr:hypothetical protein [Polyangiaceae bacterium]